MEPPQPYFGVVEELHSAHGATLRAVDEFARRQRERTPPTGHGKSSH